MASSVAMATSVQRLSSLGNIWVHPQMFKFEGGVEKSLLDFFQVERQSGSVIIIVMQLLSFQL